MFGIVEHPKIQGTGESRFGTVNSHASKIAGSGTCLVRKGRRRAVRLFEQSRSAWRLRTRRRRLGTRGRRIADAAVALMIRAMSRPILLLAGSAEAREIAARLGRDARWEPTISYADRPRVARHDAGRVRLGGFGGAEGFLSYLRRTGTKVVVDATHPFAARIAGRTARLCEEAGVDRLKVVRPGWTEDPGDDWTRVPDAAAAGATLAPGETVFVASGRDPVSALRGRGAHLICRRIEPPSEGFPGPDGEWLRGTPPFSVGDEIELFRGRGVRRLVVKDAGGAASRTKLDAARELGIPVTMIDRPRMPPGGTVATVDAAMAWLEAQWSDA